MKSYDERTRTARHPAAATREETPVMMRGGGHESCIEALQRVVNVSPRIVGQRRELAAAFPGSAVQRVCVPGTDLDTANLGDHAAIYDRINNQRITLDELSQLVPLLEGLPHLTAFESMLLSFARYHRAARRDINEVFDRGSRGGIWTMATVLVDGRQALVTLPERAEFGRNPDDYSYTSQGQGVSQAELGSSENDSEIATLEHLSQFFGATPALATASDVNVILSGSMGPCDGCKGRIRLFAHQAGLMARNSGAHYRLIIDVNYSTDNNVPQSRQTLYGYPGRGTVTVLPNTPHTYDYYTTRLTFDF